MLIAINCTWFPSHDRRGRDFVRQVKAITFGAEQQWTGTPSTVDGYLAFSTVSDETVSERMRIDSSGTTTIKTDGTTQLILNRADSSIFSGNTIGTIQATADDPSAGQVGGQIQFTGADTWSTNYYPTNIIFSNDNAGTLTERMRIDSSGTIISSKDGAGLQTNLLLSNLNDTNGDATGIGFSMLNNNTYVKAGIFFERTTTQGRGSLIFATNNEVNGNNVTLSDERMRYRS